jgi:hypothetical protein
MIENNFLTIYPHGLNCQAESVVTRMSLAFRIRGGTTFYI